jgi:hypothetical protein
MRAVVPLEGEPRFRPFPFAPPLDGPLRRAVDDAAGVLARTRGRFDGPIAFCHGVSRDGAMLRRKGRYAEAMVVFAEPTQAYRIGFALGVQLFVERPEGLGENDLLDFGPVAVVLNDDTGSALVVYHAVLGDGVEPEPNAAKVAELFWARSPSELGAQVSADTVACWSALQAWREEKKAG